MRALSIRQPWPWAILFASKSVENRDWRTTYRGRILLHASKGCTREEYDEARAFFVGRVGLDIGSIPRLEDLPRGAIVGAVTLSGVVSESDSPWFVGRFGFVLRDPVALIDPVPCRGDRGIFEVPPEVALAVAQSARATGVRFGGQEALAS